jgi:hypothetical protein
MLRRFRIRPGSDINRDVCFRPSRTSGPVAENLAIEGPGWKQVPIRSVRCAIPVSEHPVTGRAENGSQIVIGVENRVTLASIANFKVENISI